MITWMLVLAFLGVVALVGFYQGAVRVACSLLGLLLATALAMPLSEVIKPLLKLVGLGHPTLLAFLGPVIAWLVVVVACKIGGLQLHRKLETYYKYKANDTHRLLFERMNARVGIPLGLANGAVYFLLFATVTDVLGYASRQLAPSDKEGVGWRALNGLHRSQEATGVNKAVAGLNPATPFYLDAVDALATVFHNPAAQKRLATYPPFLTLAETERFTKMGNDTGFQSAWTAGPAFGDFIETEHVKPLVRDRELYTNLVARLGGDVKDLQAYLDTSKSPKFDDEKILGRWKFQLRDSFQAARKKKTNMTSAEINRLRRALGLLNNATLLATPDGKAALRMMEGGKTTAIEGAWRNLGGYKYALDLTEKNRKLDLEATVDGDRVTFTKDGLAVVFEK
jgi:hypothetical protein